MDRVLHLSDLHLLASAEQERAILAPLVEAVETTVSESTAPCRLIAVTGDVFDSSSIEPGAAIDAFASLLSRLRRAIGHDVPAVVIPGNHDRRIKGVVGSNRPELFCRMRDALEGQAHVYGCRPPFLADLVAPEIHQLPASLVAYDTTHIARGLIGAGGLVRKEEILQIAAQLPHDESPLVLLIHHHLIPTPLTDVSHVDGDGTNALLRWAMREVLPAILANADREELMMTAVGAGTALSTLHWLGRAVLVLHGHKHYPTARLLRGTVAGHGDVLLCSAGSAGVAQRWAATAAREALLWPGFNWIHFDGERLDVEAIAFSPRTAPTPPRIRLARRHLVHARRRGATWDLAPVPDTHPSPTPRLLRNEARWHLLPHADAPADLWDAHCERHVVAADVSDLAEYVEVLDGRPGTRLSDFRVGREGRPSMDTPAKLVLPTDGTPASFRLPAHLFRTHEAAQRSEHDSSVPFEWVGLMNRYDCVEARLELIAPDGRALAPFASTLDLGSGQERPVPLARTASGWLLVRPLCPARTLLRIHWPIE